MKVTYQSRSLTKTASTVEILRRYSMFNFNLISFKLSHFQTEKFSIYLCLFLLCLLSSNLNQDEFILKLNFRLEFIAAVLLNFL